jgi:hypothetical protein
MNSDTKNSEPSEFNWQPQPEAAQLLDLILKKCCQKISKLAALETNLQEQTGTRLVDWIDHIELPFNDALASKLLASGFAVDASESGTITTWRHTAGLFPPMRLGANRNRVALKVDSIDDFMAAAGRATGETLPFRWPSPGQYRLIVVYQKPTIEVCAVERHGYSGFTKVKTEPELIEAATDHLATFRVRNRQSGTDNHGFLKASEAIRNAAKEIGTPWACDLFFRAEREYWQSRNKAARVQYRRQQRLGLGWANHDHHTYRSSRERFVDLIGVLEELGFECRERFYAGHEAGWGAQVLEQPDSGIVVFADVDLSPDEVQEDFAHVSLPKREGLGTVGLWCRLHGEAFLDAGMHHLECQFDFDKSREQLAGEGVETMVPFTDFPYLKQAFTQGEIWRVAPANIDALIQENLITNEQADEFRNEGALGSHLEILERNDGYKGFNQTGISDIITRTDPRQSINQP